jgi:hypothetical protein
MWKMRKFEKREMEGNRKKSLRRRHIGDIDAKNPWGAELF